MGILKEKSKFNLDAAEFLQEKSLYAPSVHCSYYSCLQLLKVTINEFMGITYEELECNIRNAREKQKLNTHTYIIKQISDEIHSFSREEHAIFNRNIKDLKKFREISDYQDVQITTTESNKAYTIAKDLRVQISKIFNV